VGLLLLPFKGTFRTPFVIDSRARHARTDRKHAAFDLADDFKMLSLIQPTELSVGFPTVRLELMFRPVTTALSTATNLQKSIDVASE